jgi:S-disulfanyl-L-cysteine oxidoreductase SoxD
MFTFRRFCTTLVAVWLWSAASDAQDFISQSGTPVGPEELSKFFVVLPDGSGLPAGKGTAADGLKIFAEKCAHCHGEQLEGIKDLGRIALVGGRGSLASDKPLKTVESYWPYTSTLYDYIWRAMPFDQPGSLAPDEIYALCAYILSVAEIINEKQVMDRETLPKVVMPNVNGFYDGADPDVQMNRAKTTETPK